MTVSRCCSIYIATLLFALLSDIGAAERSDAETDSLLVAKITELRKQCLYEEALTASRDLLSSRQSNPASKPHELKDAQWRVKTFEVIVELTSDAQRLCESDILNDLIEVAYQACRYEYGMKLLDRQLVLLQGLFGEKHPEILKNRLNRARFVYRLGQYGELEAMAASLRSDSEGFFGPGHDTHIENMNLMALVAQQAGRYNEARELLEKCVEYTVDLKGEESDDHAILLHNLGRLLRFMGEFAPADSVLRKGLNISRSMHGDHHGITTMTLERLAEVYSNWRKPREAEKLFREWHEALSAFVGEGHPHYTRGLLSWVRLHISKREYATAESLLVTACRPYEVARGVTGLGYVSSYSVSSPYTWLATIQLKDGRWSDAWETLEKGQGRAVAEYLFAAPSLGRHAEHARFDSLKVAFLHLEAQRDELRWRLADSSPYGDDATRLEQRVAVLVDSTEKTQREYLALLNQMIGDFEFTTIESFELERIQAQIPRGAALVGWLKGDDVFRPGERNLWCYVIKNSGPVEWYEAPTRSGTQEGARELLRHDLTSVSESFLRAPPECRLGAELRQLYEERLEPVAAALDGVGSLIVIPSHEVLGIPVESFIADTGESLLDRYAVSYAPSATVYAWLQERSRQRILPDRPSALALGDPVFSTDPQELGTARGANRQSDLMTSLRLVRDGDASAIQFLPRLPASKEEVQHLESLVPTTTLLGPAAKEENLNELSRSGNLEGFSIIHLATHAVVHDEVPELSALVLSDAALADHALPDSANGLLTSAEILRDWKLDADLVTLSACETGLGRRVFGEGYVGLAYTFFRAGARSVIVSLWQVDDEATALLMKRFYDNYLKAPPRIGIGTGRKTKAEALREAKIWLRDWQDPSTGSRPYEHPYFWAGFILIGGR